VKRQLSVFAPLLLLLAVVAAPVDASVRVIALFSDKALLEVGDRQKIVSKGETFEGVLLQSASGRGAVVVIVGETMSLRLNQRIAGNFKKRNRDTIKISPDAQGMYFARGAINGHSTNFLVDTGATNVTLSGDKATSLGIDYRKGIRGMASTAAAVVPVWNINLDSISVGGIKIHNVTATVISGSQPRQVLLGNSFLKHMDLKQAGSILTIEKRY
jgi:aspartyl protease family protein